MAVSRVASRPVRIIVGQAAGSASDIAARLLGQWMSERLSQAFVVENRPGADGNIATEAVVRNADVKKIIGDPEFQKKYLERFAVQPVPGPIDAFAEYLRKDSANW